MENVTTRLPVVAVFFRARHAGSANFLLPSRPAQYEKSVLYSGLAGASNFPLVAVTPACHADVSLSEGGSGGLKIVGMLVERLSCPPSGVSLRRES